MRKMYFLIVASLAIILFSNSCTNVEENLLPEISDAKLTEKTELFFKHTVTNTNLSNMIEGYKKYATESDDLPFVEDYVENYGYPLWEEYFFTYTGAGYLYAIPVPGNGRTIEDIWFFEVVEGELFAHYKTRADPSVSLDKLDWLYDYFTSKMYYRPGSDFTRISSLGTRARICNDIYTGYIDANGVEHIRFSYTHCWNDGSSSGGGSWENGSEDDGRHGDPKGPIDWDSAPPMDDDPPAPSGPGPRAPSRILGSEVVKTGMKEAIKKMKEGLKEGRREYGFWIFWDDKKGNYYTGEIRGSEKAAKGKEKASMSPGPNAPADNGSHIPENALPVAYFHTHTSYSEESNELSRPVGLSDKDRELADKNNVVIFAEDYVGTKDVEDGRYKIEGGHSKDDPMKTYIYEPKK